MQKVIITGNLGADPVVKDFENGGSVANFNVGVTERGYKTKDGKEIPDHTEWFRCVVRQNGLCGVVKQYVKKGNRVGVIGKLKTREYDKDGQKERITELIVDELELLTPKSDSQAQQSTPQAAAQPQPEEKDNQLPF